MVLQSFTGESPESLLSSRDCLRGGAAFCGHIKGGMGRKGGRQEKGRQTKNGRMGGVALFCSPGVFLSPSSSSPILVTLTLRNVLRFVRGEQREEEELLHLYLCGFSVLNNESSTRPRTVWKNFMLKRFLGFSLDQARQRKTQTDAQVFLACFYLILSHSKTAVQLLWSIIPAAL